MNLLHRTPYPKPKTLGSPPPRYEFFSFFQKKDVYIDPSGKKLRKAKKSPYIFPAMILLSWALIFKVWWGAEEVCRKQYESLNKQDANAYRLVMDGKDTKPKEVPEEFRSEYV